MLSIHQLFNREAGFGGASSVTNDRKHDNSPKIHSHLLRCIYRLHHAGRRGTAEQLLKRGLMEDSHPQSLFPLADGPQEEQQNDDEPTLVGLNSPGPLLKERWGEKRSEEKGGM